jgi:CRP-like cAMP-binding protein
LRRECYDGYNLAVKSDVRAALSTIGWFAAQPEALFGAICARGRIENYATGQWIYGEGDRQMALTGVLSGAFRSYAAVGRERDVLVGLIGPGHVFGQVPSFGGEGHPTTLIAHCPSSVFSLRDADIEAITADFPAFPIAYARLIGGYFSSLIHRQARIVSLPPPARLAAELLHLHRELGGDLQVRQSDLAELIGVSRKTVNQLLGRMGAAGMIEARYGTIRLIDLPAIAHRAERR